MRIIGAAPVVVTHLCLPVLFLSILFVRDVCFVLMLVMYCAEDKEDHSLRVTGLQKCSHFSVGEEAGSPVKITG